MSDAALYYPYIHIRDVNWLKATLLLFRQVRRMVPGGIEASPEVSEFLRYTDPASGPLLGQVNLYSDRAVAAELSLAEKIANDARTTPGFVDRFSREATLAVKASGDPGFQIHRNKMCDALLYGLNEARFVWDPEIPDGPDYVEVNPRVGEAVMSTLAIACAQSEGLDVVADSANLHTSLIDKNVETAYDAWLGNRPIAPPPVTVPELFEFIILHNCDVASLQPEQIASLGADRKAVQDLMVGLASVAATIPAMDPGRDREAIFRDRTSDVLKAWKSQRMNMHTFWKKFWGASLLDPAADAVQKVLEKIGPAEATLAAASAAAAVHGIAVAMLPGVGIGLGIGLIVHGGKTYAKMRRGAAESPYRFLTAMQHVGVTFRVA